MKHLFLLIILFPSILFAQSGSGTIADPYYGDIYSFVEWDPIDYASGEIFIGTSLNKNLSVGNGGHLSILSGATIIFTQSTSNLIIKGTGQLTADADESNQITFTKSAINDNWGHIIVDNTSGSNSTIFNYCTFEYGSTSGSTPDLSNVGGAIYINHDYVDISNCIFRNNFALFGGAIFIGANKSPSISNSSFENNSVQEAGGAIYVYNGSATVIKNCIFDGNFADGNFVDYYSGGAIQLALNITDVKIINSTFVNNFSDNNGDAFFTSSGGELINCVFWGSNDQIAFRYSTGTVINSAIQGYSSSSHYSNCFEINSSNFESNGPNFNATDGSDWSIKVISPCRDAGTTPSPTVPIDYSGNSRIGPYDIGAYEVQYNRWKTTAATPDWANVSNWDGGIPSSSDDVVIPTGAANYPTGSTSQDFTVGAGKYLIIEQGARVTLGTLTNNGTLRLGSTSAGLASLILTTYTKGGGSTEEIQLFLTGGGTKTPLTYKWHYISSPVTSLAVSTFAPTYTLNVAQWVQNRPATTLSQAWVAYDGYVYSGGTDLANAFSTLLPGKGYDFFDATDNTFTFGGQLNTGDVNATLNYTSGNDQLYGYNLIGNPFSSGLDWNYIIANAFPLNTTKSLYFTRNSVLCSYINGVGVPGDVNGIIPPMQGFFSKTYSAGNTIVLAAAARTHNNIHATYKGSKSLIPLVRLALADSLLSDETVVRFDDLAKSYLDNDFDAVKMFLDPSLSSIHTSFGGTDYAINGLPFPETLLEIPVTLNIATDEETKSITASELQNLDNYNVTLTDISTGFVANLRTTPTVTFAAEKGTVAGRFILKISTITTGVENPVITNNKFNIYPANNNINIQTVADEWEGKSGSVRVLDLTGKTISDLKNTEFRKNSLTQVASPGASGIYVVEIRAGNMRYVGKVVIR